MKGFVTFDYESRPPNIYCYSVDQKQENEKLNFWIKESGWRWMKKWPIEKILIFTGKYVSNLDMCLGKVKNIRG